MLLNRIRHIDVGVDYNFPGAQWIGTFNEAEQHRGLLELGLVSRPR